MLVGQLSQGQHTVDVLVGCSNGQGGVSDGPIVSVTFTIDFFATTTTLGGGTTVTSTSTTSTTLPPPSPPELGSITLDATKAPEKRVSVSVGGTLTLPGGVDTSLACDGVLDAFATYKKLARVPGSGALSPADGACRFDVLFDLPKKVVRHKLLFDFSFAGNSLLAPLDFSQTLKVKRPKKP